MGFLDDLEGLVGIHPNNPAPVATPVRPAPIKTPAPTRSVAPVKVGFNSFVQKPQPQIQAPQNQENPIITALKAVNNSVVKPAISDVKKADSAVANASGVTALDKLPANQGTPFGPIKSQFSNAQHLAGSVIQAAPKAAAQLGTTAGTVVRNAEHQAAIPGFTPNNPLARIAAGNRPIPSLQTVKKQSGTGAALLSGVSDVASLIPAAKGTPRVTTAVTDVAHGAKNFDLAHNEVGAVGKDVNEPGLSEKSKGTQAEANYTPPQTYYHGGTPIDKNSIAGSDLGYSVTTNKNVAKWFTNTKDEGGITEHTIAPNAKVLQTEDIPQELKDNYKKLDPTKSLLENIREGPSIVKDAERKIVSYARSKGYDAIDMSGEPFVLKDNGVLDNEAEIRILNPDIINDRPVVRPIKTIDVEPTKGANPKIAAQRINDGNKVTGADAQRQMENYQKAAGNMKITPAAPKIDRTALTGRQLDIPSEILSGQITPKEAAMGDSLGMSPADVLAAKGAPNSVADILANRDAAQRSASPTDRGVGTMIHDKPAGMSPEERREIIKNNANQQTTNKVNLQIKEGNTKGAIVQAAGIAKERLNRFQTADRVGKKLSIHDQKLLSERNDPKVLAKPDNPKQFTKAANLYDDAYDYSLAADRAGDSTTLRYGGGKYAPLYLKATPEEMDKLGISPEDRIQGKYSGFRAHSRQFTSYVDAKQKANLDPLYKSPVQDARIYAEKGHTPIRNNLLKSALKISNPKDIAEHGYGQEETKSGARVPFKQGAGQLPFDVSSKLQPHLKSFKEAYKPNSKLGRAALGTAAKAGSLSKSALFLGSPFHLANIEKGFRGLTLGTGHAPTYIKGIGKFIAGAASPRTYARIEATARKDGTMDYAAKNGLVIGNSKSYLNRATNVLALTLAKAAKDHGIETGTPLATKLFNEYNHVLTKVNDAYNATSPNTASAISHATLAPGYLRANAALLRDSFRAGGDASKKPIGMFAPGAASRAAVIQGRLTTAAAAIIATAVATGQMPTFKQMLNQGGFNPNNPEPNFEGGEKTKPTYQGAATKGQVIDFPTDAPGLVAGLLTDPSHFTQSRFSPAASFIQKLLTNKNWNGDPLANPNAPNFRENLIKNAAINSISPIGVQNFSNLSNNPINPFIRQGVIQDIGGRLKSDPNDPTVKASTQYYKAFDSAKGSLVGPAQAAFNLAYGSDKDPVTGKYLDTPNSDMTAAKATALRAYPQALAAATKMNLQLQKDGQKIDPFFNLNPTQQKAYLAYENMVPLSADRTDWLNKNGSWYNGANGFATKQQGYFDSLPPSNPDKPTNPIKYPDPTPEVQQLLNQYDGLTNSTDKSSFLNNNPDLVVQFNKQTAYDNAVRTARGYAAVKSYPTPSTDLQKFMDAYTAASKADRTNIRNSNPQQYQQMIAFYDSADLATINKQGALDQLKGENDQSPSQNKAIVSVAQDEYPDPTGTYSIVPAGWMNGLTNGSSSGYYSSSGSSVFKAPTLTYPNAKIASLLKASEKTPSVKSITDKIPKLTSHGASSKLKRASLGKIPKAPKQPKPRTASISSDGLIKYGI